MQYGPTTRCRYRVYFYLYSIALKAVLNKFINAVQLKSDICVHLTLEIRDPDDRIQTAGTRAMSQSDSRIEDSGYIAERPGE